MGREGGQEAAALRIEETAQDHFRVRLPSFCLEHLVQAGPFQIHNEQIRGPFQAIEPQPDDKIDALAAAVFGNISLGFVDGRQIAVDGEDLPRSQPDGGDGQNAGSGAEIHRRFNPLVLE